MSKAKKYSCALGASDLLDHETVFLSRRRRGQKQRAAAKAWDMSLAAYGDLEYGRGPFDPKTGAFCIERQALGRIETHEACLVHRRRIGMTAKDLANHVGVSPFWLSKMERGTEPVDSLAKFWSAYIDGKKVFKRSRAK